VIEEPVVVVGAGQGGIATALALKDNGVRALVLDRADQVAAAWRDRYDRLRLNSCRWFSHLPDRRYPKGTPLFPGRDEVIAHLERHAHEERIDLRLGTSVTRIDADNGTWVARTEDRDVPASQIVVATGYESEPMIPQWPGRADFAGRLLHASEYRNPQPFSNQSVLVVGSGCSGMEIAYDLADGGARKVWLSARTPPNIVLREGPGGVPGDLIAKTLLHTPVRFADAFTNFGRRRDIGDLSDYGLPVPEEGVFSRLHRLGVVPSIVDPEVIDAIKDGRIEVVRGVESLDRTGVRLADGERIEPEVLISATGYRRGLEPLVGHLGVLDERGVPRRQGGEAAAPGLRFIGFTARPAALGYMSNQAKRAATAIARELRSSASGS
jgi:cation diffusion facilitator CzcD-associated flavoprotein CzcO